MAKRLLPEAAYDFWAVDCRDGERTTSRDTLAKARSDASAMRRRLKKTARMWFPHWIQVVWEVNEEKVLRLLGAPPKRSTGG